MVNIGTWNDENFIHLFCFVIIIEVTEFSMRRLEYTINIWSDWIHQAGWNIALIFEVTEFTKQAGISLIVEVTEFTSGLEYTINIRSDWIHQQAGIYH